MDTGTLTDSLAETLALFDGSGEPRTTTELAAELDLGRRSTYDRLERLVEQGHLKTKKAGANARVWWRPSVTAPTAPEWTAAAESLIDDVFERIDDAVYGLDEEWQFTYLNQRAEQLLDASEEDLLGVSVVDAFPNIVDQPYLDQFERAMAAQEPVVFEAYSNTTESDVEVTAYPSENGLSVYFRDVSDRKERERELQRYETVVETMNDGVYVVDEDGYFTHVNGAYSSMVGRSKADLVGSHVSTVIADDSVLSEARRLGEELAAGERTTAALEAELEAVDGKTWIGEATFAQTDGEDSQERVGVVRDVTERRERERELQRYETIVETLWDGVYALDPDENFVMANDALLEMTGYKREELLGKPGVVVHNETINEAASRETQRILEGGQDGGVLEFSLRGKDGETIEVESRFGPYRYAGDRHGRCGVVRDISARKEYERYLEEAKSQLEAATKAGAVGTFEWRIQPDEMVAGTSFARTFGIDPDAAREGVSLDQFLERIHEDDRVSVERAVEAALERCGSYEEEYRVKDADGEYRWVVARGEVECDEDGTPVTFPGALTDITERKEAELALERQREQLAALNNLNQVVREITDAVIDQSTREEIEQTVCEHLADSESYRFAWIGDVDGTTETVSLRTEAGVSGYLDDVTISVDPDDERSTGPTGRALLTGEIQLVRESTADPRHDPWRDHVEQFDIRSSVAIPIVHGDTTYGVLNVYADRPNAFDGQERTVIAQLGEIVGHAIAAAERKRALMSDELVELEFRMENALDEFGIDGEQAGRVTLDHAVPLGEDDFLVYGTAEENGRETIEVLVASLAHWESVQFHGDGDPEGFELRLSDPPVLSTVASLGGYVETAAIEDGDYRMQIYLAPSVDVRRVIDAVEGSYPTAEMISRRQISRSTEERERHPRHLVADLTPRQRSALEAAYYAGFFEWPRTASGEEVAESLDIASPTFHQHLRKAENKVFDRLFATTG